MQKLTETARKSSLDPLAVFAEIFGKQSIFHPASTRPAAKRPTKNLVPNNVMNIKINPSFHSLIPPLAPEELNQLEANLLKDGCRDSLVTWKGVLLDGHNRFEICERREIKFKTVELDLPDENAARIWIIRNQFGRRNITLASRCELAEELAEALRPQAMENQKQSKGRGKKGFPILGDLKVNTLKDAAKEAGVSHGSLAAFRFLKENGTPEELAELKRDPNAKLHRLVKDVKERKAREARQSKRTEAAKGCKLDSRIIIGDFRKHADKVADGSLALIFTDPPYNREASEMLPALADFAASKLADGGSLICYVGQTQLPIALDALRTKLRYWWTIACVHAGRSTVMREYGINAGWKAVLWFVKGTRDNNSVMVNDVMSGGEQKSHHDWQQAQPEAEYWIEKLCPKNGVVCDPFLGGGTTAAAAKALGRKWIAFEIDPDIAKIASARLEQELKTLQSLAVKIGRKKA
jgi:hypothetical protein